jgi:thiol-disulfide isomerase/thioredoxin
MTKGVRERKLNSFGWVLPALVLVLVLTVFLLYIGRGAQVAPRRSVDNTQPPQVGKAPPEIRGVAFDGSAVDLYSLRGKVVLVNFFASWCAECRAEIPDIEQAYKAERAAGFDVIAVNAWENGDGRAFLMGLGGTYPAIADPLPAPNRPGPIAASYGLDTQALPVSVFIDRSGNVHQVYPGRIDAGNIASELHQMGIS